MPKNYIYETSVCVDYEENKMWVDTTREGVASQLRRAGFTETTRPDSKPYRRFIGKADQIRFRKTKADRPARKPVGFAKKSETAPAKSKVGKS